MYIIMVLCLTNLFSKQFLYRIFVESLYSFENVCLAFVRGSLGKMNLNYKTTN